MKKWQWLNYIVAKFPMFVNTSFVDYKWHDERAAALQALKAKLEEQFNDSFTVSSLLIFKFSLFIIVTRFMLTLKILKSAALSCCMENVFAPTL